MNHQTQTQPADASSTSGWWWTLARQEAVCEACEVKLPTGQKIAYHYAPAKVRCLSCAYKTEVAGQCKASKKLQRSERALERHSVKVLELKEALERRSGKVLEIRKALFQGEDGGEEVAVALKPL